MKAGSFNVNDYINKLYEEVAAKNELADKEGLIIPSENKRSYDWLKKEYQKAQVEVKVEMKLGDSKFEPGYDLQTKLDSVKDFKPGMFGAVKTGDIGSSEKINDKPTVGELKQEKIGDKSKEEKPVEKSTEKSENNSDKTSQEKPKEKSAENDEEKSKDKTKEDKNIKKKEEKTKLDLDNGKPKKININLKSKKEDEDDKE